MDHKAILFSTALAGIMALPAMAVAQDKIGEAAFMANCAACHGVDGKGNGPIIDFMKSAPADLTMIAARNGGTFPIEAVYATIADAEQTRGHGTSEMPIWGNRFNADVIAMEGEYGMGKSGVPTAQARILELVYYLATIQAGS
ncbi:cytochrome c [Aestuariicoccus sp. MJ-SS9]|uniref:c-type cytochrome n=1 Tax=Aestuariicoccus sp. MJ-SS9 TaxID=3079855 RepID=UPI00290AEC1D|nr:cytochrome c [Aestuariicoccus sp. MJ-SS9]MDU8913395.1 cytochrome c [Aestuariicoccus sp. MJ-SS9]